MDERSSLGNQFFNNLFGTIARGGNLGLFGGMDFAPNGKGGVVHLTGKGGNGASWLGLKNPLQQKYAYEFCFPVAAVCDKLAELDINGTVQIKRIGGKGKDQPATNEWSGKMRKLLEQPNPLQTWEEFRGQQVVYKKIFGFCPVFPVIPAGYEHLPEEASAIINIPPWLFEPVGTNKLLYQSKLEDIVKEYRVTILGSSFVLKPNQVFILTDSFLQDERKGFIVPMSRLCGLDFAISNICAAMEADNIMLRRAGPAAILSPPTKDGMGTAVAMSEEDKADVQADLNHYGVTWGQFQYMISRNPLQVQTVGFNAKQLGTKDTIIQNEKAICHRFSYPYTLYEETEATYANGSNAGLAVYVDNVIPSNVKDLNKYNKFFKASENNCIIACDYTQLEVMQEDALNREHANFFQSQALALQWTNNIITRNQWLEAQGYDILTPDLGDVYFNDLQPTATDETVTTTTIAA